MTLRNDRPRIKFLPDDCAWLVWGERRTGLCPWQVDMLLAGMFRPMVPTHHIVSFMWPDEWDIPLTEKQSRGQRLWNFNQKLRPFGLKFARNVPRPGMRVAGYVLLTDLPVPRG